MRKSGNFKMGDLRNMADLRRYTALAATVRNCHFPYARVSREGWSHQAGGRLMIAVPMIVSLLQIFSHALCFLGIIVHMLQIANVRYVGTNRITC
jgi:hypothetical protein